MNSEYIQLPDFLIADLYRSNLVIVNEEQKTVKTPVQAEKTSLKQWYLGSNLRNITILVREKEAVYLKEDALLFITSILEACKLNLGDVAIVNYENEKASYTLLKEKLQCQNIILFSVTPKEIQIPFTMPNYQVQQHDNCQFLLVPPLEKLLGNSKEAKLEKSKLWLCLKKMFALQ